MRKFLAPAALALALTASGAAFAAEMNDGIDYSLYEETSQFTQVQPPAFTTSAYWQSADRQTQTASRAPMADQHGQYQGPQAASEEFIWNQPE